MPDLVFFKCRDSGYVTLSDVMARMMAERKFGDLALQVGETRINELVAKAFQFVSADDKVGFLEWRASLPEHEVSYLHQHGKRGLTARMEALRLAEKRAYRKRLKEEEAAASVPRIAPTA